MTHLDPDLLALLGLGEDAAGPADRLHLAGCAACRAEVRRYARPVAAGREADDLLTTPGPRVWSGIAAELGLAAEHGEDPLALDRVQQVPVETGRAPVVRATNASSSPQPGPEAVPAPASIERARRLRRPRTRLLVVVAAAAAAVVLIGGVGVGLLTARSAPQQIAAADLQALPGWQGRSGTAVLERLPDGRRVIDVRTTVQPDAGADHEVWLMTNGARRLVSLGVLKGTSGTFAVPSGVDVDRFHLVDVSEEPRDGDPAHSGDSIVRGSLRS